MSRQDYNSKNIDDNIPTKLIESKTISKKAEETCVQHKYSREKSPEDENIISTDSTKPTVKKTVKTYQRKVIRKIGPNGEVSEEIFESGDMIPENMFTTNLSNETNEEKSKSKLCGKSEIQASYGMRSTLASGEENTEQFTTGPTKVIVVDEDKHSYPPGATVTKRFQQDKTRTVTHSTTVNGESKILSSKSTYLSISGKSDLKVKSTEETSATNESISNESQIMTSQNSEDLQNMMQDIKENILSNEENKINDENTIEHEKPVVPVRHQKLKIQPITITPIKMSDEEIKKRLEKLSKLLKFRDGCPKIDILDKEFIKDGEVQALEDTQTTPGILKKIADGRMIKLCLIIFRDVFILALKKSSKELDVIECCDKDKVEASKYSIPGGIKSNFAQQKKGSNLFSCASKNSPKKDISNHLFALKFNTEIAAKIKNVIILTATNIEERDQWVWIISQIS